MNAENMEQELFLFKSSLHSLIIYLGINETVNITGLKYQDIQAWIKHRRKWSYEKILKVSKKLEENALKYGEYKYKKE